MAEEATVVAAEARAFEEDVEEKEEGYEEGECASSSTGTNTGSCRPSVTAL